MNKEILREAVYGFISFYTQDEIERLDMRFVADKYIEEEFYNNQKGVYYESQFLYTTNRL